MLRGSRTAVAALLAAAMLLTQAVPARADVKSFLYSKKFYGALSMASSVFFFKEAYDARREANRSYESYKKAANQQQATTSYNESKRGDTRMALMVGLGLGTLGYGLYLYFIDHDGDELDKKIKEREGQIRFNGIGLDVEGDVAQRAVILNLTRKF